jgi:hypothetical protein
MATFGIEFETNILFSELGIREVLQRHKIKGVLDTDSSRDRDELTLLGDHPRTQGRKLYPGWIMRVKESQISDTDRVVRERYVDVEGQHQVRRLWIEPLLLAKQLLRNNSLDASIRGMVLGTEPFVREPSRPNEEKPIPHGESGDFLITCKTDYSRWTLSTDASLVAFTKARLVEKYIHITRENQDSFDSFGIELLTPVLSFANKERDYQTIQRYLETFTSGPNPRAFPPYTAGMHVHVGLKFDNGGNLTAHSTRIVRYLAYILLLHEDIITQCFPRRRCAEHAPAQLGPARPVSAYYNRLEAMGFDYHAVRITAKKYTSHLELRSNTTSFARVNGIRRPFNLAQLYKLIFLRSIDRVINDLQPEEREHVRGFFYNFLHLLDGRKPTIEFRQHEGTVDLDKVKHWIDFLHALLRKSARLDLKADFKIRNEFVAGQFPSDFPFTTIAPFCEWLRLPATEVAYWQGRWEKYHLDRPSADAEKNEDEMSDSEMDTDSD